MTRNDQAPTTTQDTRNNDSVRIEHPAYGLAIVTRQQSMGTELYGSSLSHKTTISVELTTAHTARNMHRDWHHQDDCVCRFTMSESQWAVFVSAIGNGDGVPVTFTALPKTVDAEFIPGIVTDESIHSTFSKEIERECRRYVEHTKTILHDVEALILNGKANKAQLGELRAKLSVFADRLPRDMGFIQESFAEAMETVVDSGKVEVEAFIQSAIHRAGIESLTSAQHITAAIQHDKKDIVG